MTSDGDERNVKGQRDAALLTGARTRDSPSGPPVHAGHEPIGTTQSSFKSMPPLGTILSADDFALVASRTASPKTWAFYSSAATDLHTLARNRSFFSRIWLRPRVLRDVSRVSTAGDMLGQPCSLPLYAAPAALARLIHPGGESALARACAAAGVPYIVSTNTSCPLAEVAHAHAAVSLGEGRRPPLFFQLYMSRRRADTEALLARVQRDQASITALFLTVDAPVPGKREADERLALPDQEVSAPESGARPSTDARGGGLGRTMGAYIDDGVCWDDVAWLRARWQGRLVLKGVQTAADARLAVRHGLDGIVVSNHGGRSLDTSTPAIMVLLELRRECPDVFDALEVFVDGGVRRGTDLVKCLCLGAKAVGMGRSFLYALGYGSEGVERLVDIIRDEVVTTMKMLGVNSIQDLHPGLLNTLDVDHLVPKLGEDHGAVGGMRAVARL